MMESLRGIDRTAVQQLIRIKKEQDLLQKYMKKADSLKAKTNETVYGRVVHDYKERDSEFDRQAAPLKIEARQQYRVLSSVLDELKRAFEAATVSKEELEFRHAIGELKEKELDQHIQEVKQILDLRSNELAKAKQVKKEFLAAFNSEEELSEEGPLELDAQAVSDPSPLDAGPLATNVVPVPSEVEEVSPKETPQTSKKGEDAEDMRNKSARDSTFMVPVATLMTEDKENSLEFHLGALSYIGRGKDNQIRLSGQGVSRRHAVVSAGPEGFKIKDLESQNGTFINQKRVSECVLADGDRVRIGFVELTFRLA